MLEAYANEAVIPIIRNVKTSSAPTVAARLDSGATSDFAMHSRLDLNLIENPPPPGANAIKCLDVPPHTCPLAHTIPYMRGCLFTLRDNGLDEEWLRYTIDHLSRWKALRPYRKSDMASRVPENLGSLSREVETLRDLGFPDLNSATWEQLAPLYDHARAIKGSDTPVFGSKFCHFIVPSAYWGWG